MQTKLFLLIPYDTDIDENFLTHVETLINPSSLLFCTQTWVIFAIAVLWTPSQLLDQSFIHETTISITRPGQH